MIFIPPKGAAVVTRLKAVGKLVTRTVDGGEEAGGHWRCRAVITPGNGEPMQQLCVEEASGRALEGFADKAAAQLKALN